MAKRMKSAAALIEKGKIYTLAEAVSLVKKASTAKFDETIEVVMNLNLDSAKSDQGVRGVLSLPRGSGKTYRVAVFAKGAKAQEAQAAGADIVGAEDLADQVQAGKMDFDRCVATPDMMGLVGRVGKILGPRGLMPNPKLGTVTMDVGAIVKAIKGGQIEYRAEKAGVVQCGVGKASFDEAALVENITHFVDTLQKARPAGVKGAFVKSMYLTSTMGPSARFSV